MGWRWELGARQRWVHDRVSYYISVMELPSVASVPTCEYDS